MRKKLFFAAVALVAFASCTSDDFIGDVTTPQDNSPSASDAIVFSSASKGITRADKVGADAADLLGNQFIVLGVKGTGTGIDQTTVFSNYLVEWTQNTAGKTESNTSDWEYVGKTPVSGITGVNTQTIKYWDFSAAAYDFAAYSVGQGVTITTGTPTAGQIQATPISYAKTDPATVASYSLTGALNDLTKCYITDMKTVPYSDYKNEVVLNFRSLASKVRMALYETVPGYSVKDVRFYVNNTADVADNNTITNTTATLFGTNAFYTGGTYTVTFPHIGSTNSTNPDYNKAHVAISGSSITTTASQSFGALNYTTGEGELSGTSGFLKLNSYDPSFAGSSTYYQTVLPNEDGVVLELRVNYTLVSTDGSGEEITIHGAKAFVPAAYTKWMPNYAYTYIFKISDNTNGWSKPGDSGDETKAGLFPITFDAVVLDSEETGQQTTITTVATPSITTYQKGHVYSASNEYKLPTSSTADDDDIYVQVMNNDGTLVTNLNASGKSYFYKLSAAKTEADVMNALNIRTSGSETTVVGRNGLTLTPSTAVYTVTSIPGEDGNSITQYYNGSTTVDLTAGMVGKLTPSENGIYAYVYQVSTGTASDVITAVATTTDAPEGWVAGDENIYYSDAACTTKVTDAWGDTLHNKTYYRKYTDLNNVYAVKVIKVGQSMP